MTLFYIGSKGFFIVVPLVSLNSTYSSCFLEATGRYSSLDQCVSIGIVRGKCFQRHDDLTLSLIARRSSNECVQLKFSGRFDKIIHDYHQKTLI